jgi:hypothetical protein
MALRRDDIGGLHRPWWANFTAFAFVVSAYENPAIYRCGARPIQGPGRGRAVPGGISYVMRLASTGSEMHALRLEAACILIWRIGLGRDVEMKRIWIDEGVHFRRHNCSCPSVYTRLGARDSLERSCEVSS